MKLPQKSTHYSLRQALTSALLLAFFAANSYTKLLQEHDGCILLAILVSFNKLNTYTYEEQELLVLAKRNLGRGLRT